MTGRHRKLLARCVPWRVAALTCIAGLCLSLSPRASLQVVEPQPSPLATFDTYVRFDEDLFQTEDIILRGVSTTHVVNFTRPAEWKVSGGELRLVIEHSPELMAQRSTLTISVNETTLASLGLDESNQRSTEVLVPIPVGLIQDYNRLALSANQHYTLDCEDPFNAALWTKVAKGSSFRFTHSPSDYAPTLPDLPAPAFSPLRYGPARLELLLPTKPSQSTLSALSVVALWFGQSASYHSTDVAVIRSLAEAKGPVLLVGTPQELPDLASLGVDLSGDHGHLQTGNLPGLASVPYLAVTGSTGDAVLKAARALSREKDRAGFAGASFTVERISEPSPSHENDWPGFLPVRERFSLSELDVADTTVRGISTLPIVVDFKRPPQFQIVEGEPEMTLRYAYGAQLDTRLSTVEVKVDDVTMKSIALDDPDGQTNAETTFPIPDYRLLNENSKLQVMFHLFPKDYDPCRRVSDQQIWGTLLSTTELSLPRDYFDELPDLDALRNGGFPFTRRQDLGGAAIVLPDDATPDDIACGVEVAVRLGRLTKSDGVAIATVTSSRIADVADRDLIVIGTRASQPLLSDVLASAAGRDAVLSGDGQDLGVIEEVISPWSSSRVVLAVAGRDAAALDKGRRAIADDKLFAALGGSVAVIAEGAGGRLSMRTIQAVPRELVGELPWHRQPLVWLKRNWFVVIAGGLVGVALFYFLIRILLLQYRERRRRAGLEMT